METYGLEQLGIVNAAAVYRNLTPAQLTEHALRRGEGTLSATGALVVKTASMSNSHSRRNSSASSAHRARLSIALPVR